MDFALSDEQKALRELARSFAQKEIAPLAAKYDREQKHPQELVDEAHSLGLMNIAVPEEYGGGGLGVFEDCLVAEELAAACAGIASIIGANGLAVTPILIAGTPEQKKEHLTPFCARPNLASFCLTEPGAGSDAGAIRTTARKDGADYIINGTKCFISNGGVASLYTLFATVDPEKTTRGITAFIASRHLPGISIGKKEDKMGQRATDTSEVLFEEVRVPAANRLGQEGEGFKIAMMTLDKSRASIGAVAVGVARAALEAATNYAKERVQFGQPIANFQAIQFLLADMAMKVEAARFLVWQSAWMADKGIRNTKESAIAKCLASDVAMEVTTDAVQVFGGYGYMKDYPVEKYMRDAKLLQIYEGTNQIQRLVIAKTVLG